MIKKSTIKPLRRTATYLLTAALLSTGILGADASQASAAAPVKLEKKSATLTIKKTDKKTTYGKAVINVQYLDSVKVTKIKYTSKNKKIATVSSTGTVKAKKKGSTKITVSVRYKMGKKTRTKKLTYKVKVVTKDLRKKATATKKPVTKATGKPTARPTKTPSSVNNFQNTEGKNTGDVAALNKIIEEQKKSHEGEWEQPSFASIENLDSKWYTWNEQGFLIEINWMESNLGGHLSFSELKHLQKISLYSSDISSLDVKGNAVLTDLSCDANLTSLDLSNNTALKTLNCNSNQLTSLDLSKNTALTELYCSSNQLTSLDLSNNTALINLQCVGNQLTSLDLSNNIALEDLWCVRNQLSSLNLRNNTGLEVLICDENQLTTLDLSANKALKELTCTKNQLTSLNLNSNTVLTYLYCYDNSLTSLDLSNNILLEVLSCDNQVTVTGYNKK